MFGGLKLENFYTFLWRHQIWRHNIRFWHFLLSKWLRHVSKAVCKVWWENVQRVQTCPRWPRLRSFGPGVIKSVDLNTLPTRGCKVKYANKSNEHVRTRTFVCRACFYQFLARMMKACGKSAWNLRTDRKTPNYWRVLSSRVLRQLR